MGRGVDLTFLLVVVIAVLFVLPVVFSLEIQDDLHLNLQVVDGQGKTVSGTYNFKFDVTNDSGCQNVLYSTSASLTTDSRGIISYYLKDVNLDYSEQYYLCYYRDSVLIDTVQIAMTPYAFRASNVPLSGVEVDSNLDMSGYNLTMSGDSMIYFPNTGLNHIVHNTIRVDARLQAGEYSEIQMPSAYASPFTFKSAKDGVGIRVTDFSGADYLNVYDDGLYASSFATILDFDRVGRKMTFGNPYHMVGHLDGVDVYVLGGYAPNNAGRDGGDLYLSGGTANTSLTNSYYGDVFISKDGGNTYLGGYVYGSSNDNLFFGTETEKYTGLGSIFIGTDVPTGSTNDIIVIGGKSSNQANVGRSFGTANAIYINPSPNSNLYSISNQVIFGERQALVNAAYQIYPDLSFNTGQTASLPGQSTILTGTGTTFLSTFRVGQPIRMNSQTYVIKQINSDTEIILATGNPSTMADGGTIKTVRDYGFAIMKSAATTDMALGVDKYGRTIVEELCLEDGTCLSDVAVNASSSVWNKSGNNIYYNDGYVGLGTSTPTAMMEIQSGTNKTFYFEGGSGRFMELNPSLAGNGAWRWNTNDGVVISSDGAEVFRVNWNKRVGINENNPEAQLHVGGDVIIEI